MEYLQEAGLEEVWSRGVDGGIGNYISSQQPTRPTTIRGSKWPPTGPLFFLGSPLPGFPTFSVAPAKSYLLGGPSQVPRSIIASPCCGIPLSFTVAPSPPGPFSAAAPGLPLFTTAPSPNKFLGGPPLDPPTFHAGPCRVALGGPPFSRRP